MTSRDLASLAAILPAAARTQNEVIEALEEQVSKLKETVAVSFCCAVVTDKYTLLKLRLLLLVQQQQKIVEHYQTRFGKHITAHDIAVNEVRVSHSHVCVAAT